MSPPILHSRWYEEKSWIYFYSLESLAGVAHQVEITAQQPGPATAPPRPGWAADHWSPVRRGWSSAWSSSLHLWSRSSLTVAWLETLQSPICCPVPWLPHSAEARSNRKFSLETTQWAPKLTQNRICGLMNYIQYSDCREAVFVIIHNLSIVDCSRHLWKLLFQ